MGKLKYIALIIGLFLMSCRTVKQSKTVTDTRVTKDSVNVKETVTIEKKRLEVKADSASNEIDLKQLIVQVTDSSAKNKKTAIRDTAITNTSGRSTLNTVIRNGVMTNKCNCDTAAIAYEVASRLKEVFKQHLNDNERVETETKVIEVKVYPRILIILASIGALSCFIWIFILINFLKKKAS